MWTERERDCMAACWSFMCFCLSSGCFSCCRPFTFYLHPELRSDWTCTTPLLSLDVHALHQKSCCRNFVLATPEENKSDANVMYFLWRPSCSFAGKVSSVLRLGRWVILPAAAVWPTVFSHCSLSHHPPCFWRQYSAFISLHPCWRQYCPQTLSLKCLDPPQTRCVVAGAQQRPLSLQEKLRYRRDCLLLSLLFTNLQSPVRLLKLELS